MLEFPSNEVVDRAADVVVDVLTPHLNGANKLRRKLLARQVCRLALTTAWFSGIKSTNPTPYERHCPTHGRVMADYRPHPTMPHVNAMLCGECGAVTRPLI